MVHREALSNLEFWSDRSRSRAHERPAPPRKPYRRGAAARVRNRIGSVLPEVRIPEVRIPDRWRRRTPRAQPRTKKPGLRTPAGARFGGRSGTGPGAGRARPVAAAALVAMLAGAWLAVGHLGHGPSAAGPSAESAGGSSSLPARPAVPAVVAAPPRRAIDLPPTNTATCGGLSPARPHVRCLYDGVLLEVALYTPATVGPELRRVAAAQSPARTGPAACASGQPDERTWSLPSAPQYAVGRYVCRVEAGRAAMWWTQGDRLLHSLATDADLAKLFAWWRSHPSA